ncbi:hypothetical protein CTI12_AA534300 [Artemisia annua]|uniref:Uncharacterized protein n=1 Tax=Artemisia annua TaxID=35608 RepID=A0A2U1L3R0_ARTAN|nr:hypothetical protein CTI12_AA534300 [Artemisia annua]
MFSPQYTYACYLLFKFRDNPNIIPGNTILLKTECWLDNVSIGRMFAYWSTYPLKITTSKPKNDYGLHDSSNIPRVEGLAMKKVRKEHLGYTRIEERKDGWMELMLFKLTKQLLDHGHLEIELTESEDRVLRGMIIEGIEFRQRGSNPRNL